MYSLIKKEKLFKKKKTTLEKSCTKSDCCVQNLNFVYKGGFLCTKSEFCVQIILNRDFLQSHQEFLWIRMSGQLWLTWNIWDAYQPSRADNTLIFKNCITVEKICVSLTNIIIVIKRSHTEASRRRINVCLVRQICVIFCLYEWISTLRK